MRLFSGIAILQPHTGQQNHMIKKLIAGWMAALCLIGGAYANEGGMQWDKFPTERMTDLSSLQNGAKLFVNYCLNCHSASYLSLIHI